MFWPFSPSHSSNCPLIDVPGDLLIEIALALDTLSDVLNFALTSNHIYFYASSVLYEKVSLNTVEQCKRTLGMLERRPDVASHVRELIIRPRTEFVIGEASIAPSLIASAAVRQVAASKHLDALTKFIWDTGGKPYHDDMWFALRMGCPQLRHVGTSIGACLPPPRSHLLDFVDLAGFSLVLKPGFYSAQTDVYNDEENEFLQKIWRMLIHRSPNLEELTVEGSSPAPANVYTLVQGRWPKLRKLALGDVAVDFASPLTYSAEKRPFVEFLEAHPQLESLSISKFIIQPGHLVALDPGAFPKLTSFSGTLQQLQAVPYLHPYLRNVTFRNPILTREVPAQAVAALLQDIPHLQKLKIGFMLHSMYDSGTLLRSLITSCPHLRDLELTCGNKPSFQLNAFSKTVRGFPKLRRLHLTIVKYPGDESLSTGAARIAKCNPRLSNFTLTFIPPTCPLALPFSVPYLPFPVASRATGTFALTCDHHGLPLSLAGSERRKHEWPWGLGVSRSTKRWVQDLRPQGALGRRTGRWRDILTLCLERSAAGEEMRMILYCAMLVGLALWGFSVNAARLAVPHRPGPRSTTTFSWMFGRSMVSVTSI